MSNEDPNPYDPEDDPTFDLEDFMDEHGEEEDWPFELDENGELTAPTVSRKQKALMVADYAIGTAVNFLLTLAFYFLLVVGIAFLMDFFGIAFPVA